MSNKARKLAKEINERYGGRGVFNEKENDVLGRFYRRGGIALGENEETFGLFHPTGRTYNFDGEDVITDVVLANENPYLEGMWSLRDMPRRGREVRLSDLRYSTDFH